MLLWRWYLAALQKGAFVQAGQVSAAMRRGCATLLLQAREKALWRVAGKVLLLESERVYKASRKKVRFKSISPPYHHAKKVKKKLLFSYLLFWVLGKWPDLLSRR